LSYKQNFEIKAAELPVIDGIEINGSTVKITASGGTKPYRYAIDNGVYQDSNTFTDLSRAYTPLMLFLLIIVTR
jgi:hypothetical protein